MLATTGWPRTTSPVRCPRRCGPAGLPPRRRRLRRRSDTSSSRSSCGSQVPDAEQRAGVDHPSCSRRPPTRPRAPGALRSRAGTRRRGARRRSARRRAEHRATLLVRRAELLLDLGRDDEGMAVLEQAVGLLPPDSPSGPAPRYSALCALAGARRPDPARERTGAIGRWRRRRRSARRKRSSRRSSMLAQSMVYDGDVEAVDSRCCGSRAGEPARPAAVDRDAAYRRPLGSAADARPVRGRRSQPPTGHARSIEQAGFERTRRLHARQQGRGADSLRALG